MICEPGEGQREIVDQMVRRYLLHTRIDPREKAKLFGLALLRRAELPTTVAVALGLTEQEAQTNYREELSRLHRRYSFVFTGKSQPSLHDNVRYFLRLWLLEHRSDPEIAPLIQKLLKATQTEFHHLEEKRGYSSLKDRFLSDDWVGLYLDWCETQFWADPNEGIRYLVPFMVGAAIYRRAENEAAAKIGELFKKRLDNPYRDYQAWLTDSLIYPTSRNPGKAELEGLQQLERLLARAGLPLVAPLAQYKAELGAAIGWRLGEAFLKGDNLKALAYFEKVSNQLPQDNDLKLATAEAAFEVAYDLQTVKKHAQALTYLNQAIALDPTDAIAFNNRGNAYAGLKNYTHAIEDYTQAIALDPNYATAYGNRGIAYKNLKDYAHAIEDYTQAIALDPNLAQAFYNRGIAYDDLKDYAHAIEDYTQAIALDPNLAQAFYNRGIAYDDLKDYAHAIADYTQAIALDPTDAIAFNNRGVAYLLMKNAKQAQLDFQKVFDLDNTDINAIWMAQWASLCQENYSANTSTALAEIAQINPDSYVGVVSRAVSLGLQAKLEEALAVIEPAFALNPEEWDAYFWKGMLLAYRGRTILALEAINKALELELPPVLLLPLRWLENSRPDFYPRQVQPLFEQHGLP